MARSTVYNQITTPELIEKIYDENKELCEDFLGYLASIDRAQSTIDSYRNDLEIFFVWNLTENKNKDFIDITKREFARFQNHALNTWDWSSNRVRRVKSVLSSLSNFIEDILDEEEKYENYRSIVNKIENPVKEPVREKTILSDEQVDMLLNTLVEQKEYQKACVIALAAFSGARKSELLRFKVDFFTDDNIVFDALYRTPKIVTKGRGRGKMLNKYVLLEFKEYLDLWIKERKKIGIDSEWLFITKQKGKWQRMKVSTLDSWTNQFSEILGVPFYFHCMRHQLCTRLLRHSLPQSVIQEYFGWSSAEMISIYSDLDVSDEFGKYFNKEGIIKAEEGSFDEL